ncbi:Diaminopimelate epimerase-like protein [Gloeophyllum trabeum ATCC 11539]|uniref:Diaminopimelate epimerase-like protein n=1 Tax=Gloeophyllum trabeum (strain ATCC 11539 / FP-39264 / Madison 617) TaxID=670483 RepID=S7R909_GLOTA|nr:Diaminopimelate epimerase-like protein [Gloeophyllum trabeum ATCC 11539]EPQ50790.1 Diaminopimelate epimerase-like protein [Gloeophyllum trabeum ATCC 11539]
MLLDFLTLDVFTDTRYEGNPLGVVLVPSADALSGEQKQAIAKEFNLSETVFIYPPDLVTGRVKVNIYTTKQELSFAGHPVVGSTYYLLGIGPLKGRQEAVLDILAGLTPITYDPGASQASVRVAHDVLIHKPYKELLGKIEGLTDANLVQLAEGGVAVVSIVKGMTFLMVQLKDLEALESLRGIRDELVVEGKGERKDEKDWLVGFVGTYCFVVTGETTENGVVLKKVRTRMLYGIGQEDPATGSAASAFSAWMSLTRAPQGEGEQRYQITQGVEMGRRSEIGVIVRQGAKGVKEIKLQGQAVKVMEGKIEV